MFSIIGLETWYLAFTPRHGGVTRGTQESHHGGIKNEWSNKIAWWKTVYLYFGHLNEDGLSIGAWGDDPQIWHKDPKPCNVPWWENPYLWKVSHKTCFDSRMRSISDDTNKWPIFLIFYCYSLLKKLEQCHH